MNINGVKKVIDLCKELKNLQVNIQNILIKDDRIISFSLCIFVVCKRCFSFKSAQFESPRLNGPHFAFYFRLK